jgi:cyclohexa-1,5-dienecarbonyl-CoA hydratase
MSVAAVAATRVEADRLEDGRVLRLRLAGSRGNILHRSTLVELAQALAVHQAEPELRLVLISGSGGQFSFGASVAEHRAHDAPALLASFHHLARLVAGYPRPVAALVEGSCLGAGFELALCCHFVFAAPDARFGCPEIRLGVFPPVLAALAHLRLPSFAAERLLLTGETLDAAAAEGLGIVTRRVAGGVEAESEVLEWYRATLAPLSSFALRQAVRALRGASGFLDRFETALAAAEALYLEELLPSHDGNEGIAAFLERRPPQWRDA